MDSDDDDVPTIGVSLKASDLATLEAHTKTRIKALRVEAEKVASSIVWVKTRNETLGSARSKVLAALESLREAEALVEDS